MFTLKKVISGIVPVCEVKINSKLCLNNIKFSYMKAELICTFFLLFYLLFPHDLFFKIKCLAMMLSPSLMISSMLYISMKITDFNIPHSKANKWKTIWGFMIRKMFSKTAVRTLSKSSSTKYITENLCFVIFENFSHTNVNISI